MHKFYMAGIVQVYMVFLSYEYFSMLLYNFITIYTSLSIYLKHLPTCWILLLICFHAMKDSGGFVEHLSGLFIIFLYKHCSFAYSYIWFPHLLPLLFFLAERKELLFF